MENMKKQGQRSSLPGNHLTNVDRKLRMMCAHVYNAVWKARLSGWSFPDQISEIGLIPSSLA